MWIVLYKILAPLPPSDADFLSDLSDPLRSILRAVIPNLPRELESPSHLYDYFTFGGELSTAGVALDERCVYCASGQIAAERSSVTLPNIKIKKCVGRLRD